MQGNDFGPLGAMLGILCLVLGVVLIVVLVIYVFYLLTLHRALAKVSARNRMMEPGQVWLMFVPCLNLIWQFMIATNVPGSLKKEFSERGRDDGSDYGRTLGLTQAILSVIATAISQASNAIPEPEMAMIIVGVTGILQLAAFVMFIMFWIKIAGYSAQLDQDDGGRRNWDRRFDEPDDDGDDDDDRGNRSEPRGSSPSSIKEGDPGRYR